MHIALNGWFWNQPYTGSGQYLRHLTTELARFKNDLQITLVLPAHIKNPQAVPDHIQVIHAPTRLPGQMGKVWFEQRAFPAAVQQCSADIAHVPYWGPPLSSPSPLVVSVLDVIPAILPEYRGGVLAGLYTSLVVAGARGAAHILTLSEASKQDITGHLHIPPEKITVTLLAADDRFSPIPDPDRDEVVRQKYNLPEEFALYFGGFDRRKNVNTLLLAWTYVGQAMSENVPLVLAGKQPPTWGTPLFPDLPAYADRLNIQDYLMWLGEVDEADKPSLYRLATVFIWTSLYEGFGLPPLEAMASGTPVIATKATATPEVVGDAAYMVDAEDAREMGGAILAVLVQDDLHDYLVNQVRGQATKFSWRKTAEQTLAVYQQVIENR